MSREMFMYFLTIPNSLFSMFVVFSLSVFFFHLANSWDFKLMTDAPVIRCLCIHSQKTFFFSVRRLSV